MNESSVFSHLHKIRSSLKHVKTIFGNIEETNVTFCFDASGSMYRFYTHFSENLMEKLLQMFIMEKKQKFNIVIFNSFAKSFSHVHVDCNQENIVKAFHWLNKPFYETRSNMLAGLLKCFEYEPDAVYMVTDGFPSNTAPEILSHLPHITKGRPIKSIMLTDKVPPDEYALGFLEEITKITNGALNVFCIMDNGAVNTIMPIYSTCYPLGVRKSQSKGVEIEKTLDGDPMETMPMVVPFKKTDPMSNEECPFYHPYFHWYWPQYWHKTQPDATCVWAKSDPQFNCMTTDFRRSRAFITGKRFLSTSFTPSCVMPASGTIMINKKVLAFNHKDGNRLYPGIVLNQISECHFLVQFDINKEFYEAQKTVISEILDIGELKKHPIKPNDFVLAPCGAACGPYEIGTVIEGSELRSEMKGLLPEKTENLIVRFSSDNEKSIELNEALYISSNLRTIINTRRLQTNFQLEEDANDENNSGSDAIGNKMEEKDEPSHQKHRLRETNSSCHLQRHHHNLYGRISSPVDDKKSLTLDEITELVKQKQKSSTKDESTNEKTKLKECITEVVVTDDDSDENEGLIWKTNPYDSDDRSSEIDETYSKIRNDVFTETDLNWCLLRLAEKNKRRKSKSPDKQPWRYWGKKGVPNIMDPPTFEPYQNPSGWGHSFLPKTPVSLEWPLTTFHEVNPHSVSDYSPQKMYQVFQHEIHKPSLRPKRDASVGTTICLPPEKINAINYERKFKYLQGGYPKTDIKYPFKDSITPILSSWSAAKPSQKSQTFNYGRSLEKSRTDFQIKRDEANYLTYIQHKAAA